MNQTTKQVQAQQIEDLVIGIRPQPQTSEPIMASYLTHELRAPVTAIRLGLEILQEQLGSRLAVDERQMLNLAVKNTGRLQGLVNDIMDYTKLLSGCMKLARKPSHPRSMIAEAVDGLQAWAISKGIRLLKVDGAPLPRVSADSDRIVQILTNMISNALKFTPARGIVSVSASEGFGEHEGTLVFKVKDTGRGISQKDLKNIFECFQQAATNGKKSDGTGLGLTLAKSMVELHGGRIWAESWQGLGATFCFTVPIVPEDLPAKVNVYPEPVKYHGLLVNVYRRMNSFIAAFI